MKIIGIIAEYNPFHLGHLYQINKIKERYSDSIIIAVIPSCFTERGEVSVINKWNRTNVILNYGIDIVVELPFLYATQSADNFAYGAISILNMLGIDILVFGTETIDIKHLKEIAKLQLDENSDFNRVVKFYLDKGINYPTSMNCAGMDILGYEVKSPNDLLALSYIKQIYRINNKIEVVNIKRTNDYHSKEDTNSIIPASLIRYYFLKNKDIRKYLPSYDMNVLYSDYSINNYFELLRYQIINNIDSLDKFLDVDEGIENRIKKVINNCHSWNSLVMKLKTKRYTYNKINRMLVHILCGLLKEDISLYKIDYIRILGFNKKGQLYLNKNKKKFNCKIITNYKKNFSRLLDLEFRVNYIYALGVDKELINDEFSHKPIIV